MKSARFMAGYYKRPDLTADDVRRGRVLQDRRRHGRGRTRPAPLRRPPQQRHQTFAGRVRRRVAAGGAVLRPARSSARSTSTATANGPFCSPWSSRPTRRCARRSRRSAESAHRRIRRAENASSTDTRCRGTSSIETEPFSLENGLLSGVGKFLRPKLKDRYGAAAGAAVRRNGRRPGQRVARVAGMRCRPARARPPSYVRCRPRSASRRADVSPEARFIDLGGDSLSALTFSRLLTDIYGVDVPVGVVIDPTADLMAIADIHRTRTCSSVTRPTFASVHGAGTTEVRAADLTLDKFIDHDILATATTLAPPPTHRPDRVADRRDRLPRPHPRPGVA